MFHQWGNGSGTITAGSYTVEVGAGGIGGSSTADTNGGNTLINGNRIDITAVGGGAGGGSTSSNGQNGGSGGGSYGSGSFGTSLATSPGLGNSGSDSSSAGGGKRLLSWLKSQLKIML